MAIATLTSTESGANSLIDINANFADVTTSLALKANLASPTFTGNPVLPTGTTATTQSAADNSTKLATTAYVDTVGTNTEWTYVSKVTYTAESGAKTFSSLSVKDEYKLVFRLYNTTTTDMGMQITLNNITAANYTTFYTSTGSGGWVSFGGQTYFRLLGYGTTLAIDMKAEVIISGKHRQGVKGFAVSYVTDGNAARSDTSYGQTGALVSDSNDVTRIDVSLVGVGSGTVELWSRTAK